MVRQDKSESFDTKRSQLIASLQLWRISLDSPFTGKHFLLVLARVLNYPNQIQIQIQIRFASEVAARC